MYPSRDLTLELKLIESAILSQALPNFQENQVESDRFGEKNQFYLPYKIYFSNKNYRDSDMSWEVISCETFRFLK